MHGATPTKVPNGNAALSSIPWCGHSGDTMGFFLAVRGPGCAIKRSIDMHYSTHPFEKKYEMIPIKTYYLLYSYSLYIIYVWYLIVNNH